MRLAVYFVGDLAETKPLFLTIFKTKSTILGDMFDICLCITGEYQKFR